MDVKFDFFFTPNFIKYIVWMTCYNFRKTFLISPEIMSILFSKITTINYYFDGHTSLRFLLKNKTVLVGKELRYNVLFIHR